MLVNKLVNKIGLFNASGVIEVKHFAATESTNSSHHFFSSSKTSLSWNNLKASCAHNLTRPSSSEIFSIDSLIACFHLVNSLGE